MCKIQQVQSVAIIECVMPVEYLQGLLTGPDYGEYRDRLLIKCQIGSKMFNPLDLPSACRMKSKKYEV